MEGMYINPHETTTETLITVNLKEKIELSLGILTLCPFIPSRNYMLQVVSDNTGTV